MCICFTFRICTLSNLANPSLKSQRSLNHIDIALIPVESIKIKILTFACYLRHKKNSKLFLEPARLRHLACPPLNRATNSCYRQLAISWFRTNHELPSLNQSMATTTDPIQKPHRRVFSHSPPLFFSQIPTVRHSSNKPHLSFFPFLHLSTNYNRFRTVKQAIIRHCFRHRRRHSPR